MLRRKGGKGERVSERGSRGYSEDPVKHRSCRGVGELVGKVQSGVNCTGRQDTAHEPDSDRLRSEIGKDVVETGSEKATLNWGNWGWIALGRGRRGRKTTQEAVLNRQMAWIPKLRGERRRLGKERKRKAAPKERLRDRRRRGGGGSGKGHAEPFDGTVLPGISRHGGVLVSLRGGGDYLLLEGSWVIINRKSRLKWLESSFNDIIDRSRWSVTFLTSSLPSRLPHTIQSLTIYINIQVLGTGYTACKN